ncbi:MAG: DUF2384 domain-containing protein [Sphingomonadales bacterium]|nr:MAG: DUF2384 domain-containing protein [Sphingomonadales bacterium]
MIEEGHMAEESATEMRAMMARWETLRQHWALEPHEEAGLLGDSALTGPVGEIASWRASRMEQRMRLLIDLGAGLDSVLGDRERIRAWLRRETQSFGGRSAIEVMTSSVEWIRQLRRVTWDFAQ